MTSARRFSDAAAPAGGKDTAAKKARKASNVFRSCILPCIFGRRSYLNIALNTGGCKANTFNSLAHLDLQKYPHKLYLGYVTDGHATTFWRPVRATPPIISTRLYVGRSETR